MAGPALVLYFDIVSPFAYLAFHLLRTSPVFRECSITYVPVFLGGIMNKTGNSAPITIKNKGKWVGQERLRWARQFNIPIAQEMPPGFPNNTIPVMRALTAIAELYPQRLEEIVAAIYNTSFVKRQDVHTLEALKPILALFLGASADEEVSSKATAPEIKKTLAEKTDEALDSGAFGLPWFKATNSKGVEECYWGFDHLGQICRHLGLQKPEAGSVAEGGWKAML